MRTREVEVCTDTLRILFSEIKDSDIKVKDLMNNLKMITNELEAEQDINRHIMDEIEAMLGSSE